MPEDTPDSRFPPRDGNGPTRPSSRDTAAAHGSSAGTRHPSMSKALGQLKLRIHNRMVDQLKPEEVNKLAEDVRRPRLRELVEQMVDGESPLLAGPDRKQLIEELLDEMLGLGPLERLFKDPTISDILVNGAHEVWVERGGNLEKTDVDFRDDRHLLQVIDRIVSRIGRRVDETSPMVDARLPDGSRVNAIIPPASVRGPVLSIRRFGITPLTLRDLLRVQTLTPEMAQLMEAAIKGKLNILISGGTGSGKTTLLNVLSSFIPPEERLITIENAVELQLQQPHVVQLESRPPNLEGSGEITMHELVKNALRMRPNRIIVGECRGAEVVDMLQAMNTGHEGSLTTLHANSPRDALTRLEMMIMMTGIRFPIRAMRQMIASAINVIIQVDRLQGGSRRVTSFTEVAGTKGSRILTQELFTYRQLGVDVQGRAYGQFEMTGLRSLHMDRLKAAGQELPGDFFQPRVLMRE